MSQEPALDRAPAVLKLSSEEWAKFSETSRRFLVAHAARYEEMERLLAERESRTVRSRKAGDHEVTPAD
jgi:hypothetical protein